MTTGEALRRVGLRGVHLHAASIGAIGLCVGLWPPVFWLIGDAIERAG